MANNLSKHVNAWIGYTFVLIAFFKGQFANSAKFASLVAGSFNALIPPQPAFATFLVLYADVQYCRGLAQVGVEEYGNALSYGRNVAERFNAIPPKFDADILAAIRQLIDSFKHELDQIERDNRMIYYKVVRKYSEIPSIEIPPLPPADIWKSPTEALSIDDVVRRKTAAVVNQRVAGLTAAADQAIGAADLSLQKVPSDRIQELVGLVATLHSQRTLAQVTIREVTSLPPNVFDRHPQSAREVQSLNPAVAQGAAADERYETQYAKAKSNIEKVEKLAAQITGLKAKVAQARQAIEEAAQAAREGKKDKEPEMEAAGKAVGAAVPELNAAVAQINAEFETKLQNYLAETEAVKLGFAKAIDFWGKINAKYQAIRNALGGLT
jgi:hypothetical protein